MVGGGGVGEGRGEGVSGGWGVVLCGRGCGESDGMMGRR